MKYPAVSGLLIPAGMSTVFFAFIRIRLIGIDLLKE